MKLPENLVESDEKADPIMIYSPQRLIWGYLISKKSIRVSTWLKTEMAPNFLNVADAHVLLFGTGQSTSNLRFPLLHVQKDQIIAFHLLPPGDESPYYDEKIPNRKMKPVTIIVGIFRFDGTMRISEQTNLNMFLGVQIDLFLPVFDATITCSLLPSIKQIQVPFVMVNQTWSLFSGKE